MFLNKKPQDGDWVMINGGRCGVYFEWLANNLILFEDGKVEFDCNVIKVLDKEYIAKTIGSTMDYYDKSMLWEWMT